MNYCRVQNKPAFPFTGEGISGLSKIEYATLMLVSKNLDAGDDPETVDEVIEWSAMVANKLFEKIDSDFDEYITYAESCVTD